MSATSRSASTAAASGSGAAVGVLLGGVLTSYLSWPWIFFINVPVAVAAIALTPMLLRESRAETAPRHFDVAGAASITAGLMLLVYALTRATTDGWASTTTIGLLAASAVLVLGFLAIELRSPAPLLPLRIFRSRTLTAANVTMLIVGSVTFSEFFLLTLYLQDVLHYSAVQSGVAFAGFAITVVVASNVAQLVVSRFGVRATLTAGLLASAASIAMPGAAARSTATTSGTCSPRSCSAGQGWGSRSSRSRSRASPASSAPTRASRRVSSTRAARSAARSASPR